MFIKPFSIYLKISETLTKIYEFSLNYSRNELLYVRYTESRRNNTEDLWGHLWHSTYWKKRLEEENTFCLLHDYYTDSWEYNPLDSEYHGIAAKYNPVVQKTESGQSYLYSINSLRGGLPKIELEKEEVERQLKEQLYKWVDSINVSL